MLCDAACVNPETDDKHCGACGIRCIGMGAGGTAIAGVCSAAMCAPVLSPCFAPNTPFSCAEICAAQGRTCVALGCAGATHAEYPRLAECESHTGFTKGGDGCGDRVLLGDGQGAARCCCTGRAQ